MWYYLLMMLLFLTGAFMILLILVQRGKGGGLAGAFGGLGGQSAFGAKAGDTFTRVTIVVATIWILLCILGVKYLGAGRQSLLQLGGPAPVSQSNSTGTTKAPTALPKIPEKSSAPAPASPAPAKGAEKSK